MRKHCYLEGRYEVDPKTNCWNWSGKKTPDGYGRMSVNGGTVYVHRLSWELKNGKIPDGMCICHHCDNPGCINPEHLFLGTFADNNHDRTKKNRTPHGVNHYCAKFDNVEIDQIRTLFRLGCSQAKIAKVFHVGYQTIQKIVRNETYKTI